jgi:hypothetical protein
VTPVPEPAGDIRAQIAATLDRNHPKRACYMVPEDAERLDLEALPQGVYAVQRTEGTLVTTDLGIAELFDAAPAETDAFDRVMAEILGYPEDKATAVARCRGKPAVYARAVQARDAIGHVVTEVFASPVGFLPACAAIQEHVPARGRLVIMSPAAAISRRVAMRWVEQ